MAEHLIVNQADTGSSPVGHPKSFHQRPTRPISVLPSSSFHQNTYEKTCLFPSCVVAKFSQGASLAAISRLACRKNPSFFSM